MRLKKENNLKKNVFIIENTELGSCLPLSVYLTELLKNYVIQEKLNLNLIIAKSESIPEEIKNKVPKIHQIDASLYSLKDNLKFSLGTFKILRKENKKQRINIIHCLYPNSSLLGTVLFKILCNWEVKIIYDVRSPWIDMSVERGYINKFIAPIYKTLLYLEEFLLCRFVNYFVFITEGLKRYYAKKIFLNNKKTIVIPSGVDTNQFTFRKGDIRQKYRIKNNELLLGMVGTLGEERELDFVIKAFKNLLQVDKRYKLMIVGDGAAKKELEKLSKDLKINGYTIFTGKIDHQLIPKYISSFDMGICHLPDIFIFRQSFPLKILEYLSCGIPVLASNIKAHQEIAKNLRDIYIYNLEESDFIKTINRVNLNKPSLINKERLKNNYDWGSLSKKYNLIYENL